MSIGPGKYSTLTTYVREQAQADFVVVIIGGGNKGGGFDVQSTSPKDMRILPKLLRDMAAVIEADIKKRSD